MAVVPSELLRAFVDETGDRGVKASSSRHFAFAAIICRDQNYALLIQELDKLTVALGKPLGQTLHWSQNIKDHAARRLAVRTLAQLPVRTIFVVVPKISLVSGSYIAASTQGFYNYAARLMLERICLFTKGKELERAKVAPGTTLTCKVTMGHVKGFNPAVLRAYVNKIRQTTTYPPWHYLTPTLAVEGQSTARCLQWADMAAGAFDAAIKPDRYGEVEPAYLKEMALLTYQERGRTLGCGIKVLGDEKYITDLPWWRASNLQ